MSREDEPNDFFDMDGSGLEDYQVGKEKMKDKPNDSEEYKKFFNEEVNDHLAGCRYQNNKRFYDVGERSGVWLVGGDCAGFNQSTSSSSNKGRGFGFSGRLLKN